MSGSTNELADLRARVQKLERELEFLHFAEEAMAVSDALMQAMLGNARDAVFMKDFKHRYVHVNPAFEKILGMAAVDVIGLTDIEIFGKETAKHIYEADDRALAGEIVEETFKRNIRGEKRMFHVVRSPVFGKDGAPMAVCGIARDVTDRDRMENELRRSETRFHSLYDNMIEGVALHLLVFDDDGNPVDYQIVDVNARYESILGVKREDIVWKKATEAYGVSPAPYLKEYSDTALNRVPFIFETFFPPMEKHFSISVAPWGEKGFATIFTDITEKKRAEEEILKLRKIESLGVLAGGIAHDFNNALAAILGGVDYAMLIADEDAQGAKEALADAKKAIFETRGLTQQLITFAKGGAPVIKAGSIEDLLRDTCGFVLRGSSSRVEFALSPGLWGARMDAGQIGQVIQNLIINADQSMPSGGVIHVTAENRELEANSGVPLSSGKYVKVTISDNGTGISKDRISKIFDPYFTTKKKGQGLGLAMSYSIMLKHNGHIGVESTEGEGAEFTLWLPATDEAIAKKEEKPVPVQSGGTRVLIMDDNDYIRDILKKTLTRRGYSVDVASDGGDAVQMYSEAVADGKPYDIVVLDLTVPGGMGGVKTLEKLKEFKPDLKAIVASGYSADPVMSNHTAHGFTGMVVKPYDFTDLCNVIEKALDSDS